VKLSRREFLAAAAALLAARPAAATPARRERKDCFFGLHFDLHPNEKDTVLGRDLTDAMVGHLLERVRPDFVQYDSKGHPGYLGFPSRTGMSAPGIVQDSLAVWRRVTAAHGVALYNHFSGVLDGLAVSRHPEWARVGPDGKRDAQETSLFSGYEQGLMIPELSEAARNYDLDGSWVDGDCWAVKPDYCEAAREKFAALTGIAALPKGPEEPGWNEFLEMQREQFRQYVTLYAGALHRARPGYQITSNWMYSTFIPERPTVELDYLSGDVADLAAVRQARLQARYLGRCGKPWDLMSWGFEHGSQEPEQSAKPAVELEQEAAIILAQGGAYQIYYVPTRAGWIDGRVVETAAEVGRFCRRRERWAHGSESLAEVGVLYSGHSLYRTANRVFGGWGRAENPAAGAVDLLLGCGYSVDLIPDWQAAECVAGYPLVVVPDWQEIGAAMAKTLAGYVERGGRLLVCGAENAQLFAGAFALRVKGAIEEHSYFVADASGFAQVKGNWIGMDAAETETLAWAWAAADTRKDAVALAVRARHGKGSAVVCPGPLMAEYANAGTPILRGVVRGMIAPLHKAVVRLENDDPAVEVVLRRKDGQTILHLINTAGAPDTGAFRHAGMVPATGPLRLRVRLAAAPGRVFLEPEGTELEGTYQGGTWEGVLPGLHVHAMVRFAGVSGRAD
jgi:hypothetical protein